MPLCVRAEPHAAATLSAVDWRRNDAYGAEAGAVEQIDHRDASVRRAAEAPAHNRRQSHRDWNRRHQSFQRSPPYTKGLFDINQPRLTTYASSPGNT